MFVCSSRLHRGGTPEILCPHSAPANLIGIVCTLTRCAKAFVRGSVIRQAGKAARSWRLGWRGREVTMIDLGFSSALNASSSFQTRPGRPPMNFKPLWKKKPKNFDKHEREGRTPDCPQNLRESPENPNQRRLHKQFLLSQNGSHCNSFQMTACQKKLARPLLAAKLNMNDRWRMRPDETESISPSLRRGSGLFAASL